MPFFTISWKTTLSALSSRPIYGSCSVVLFLTLGSAFADDPPQPKFSVGPFQEGGYWIIQGVTVKVKGGEIPFKELKEPVVLQLADGRDLEIEVAPIQSDSPVTNEYEESDVVRDIGDDSKKAERLAQKDDAKQQEKARKGVGPLLASGRSPEDDTTPGKAKERTQEKKDRRERMAEAQAATQADQQQQPIAADGNAPISGGGGLVLPGGANLGAGGNSGSTGTPSGAAGGQGGAAGAPGGTAGTTGNAPAAGSGARNAPGAAGQAALQAEQGGALQSGVAGEAATRAEQGLGRPIRREDGQSRGGGTGEIGKRLGGVGNRGNLDTGSIGKLLNGLGVPQSPDYRTGNNTSEAGQRAAGNPNTPANSGAGAIDNRASVVNQLFQSVLQDSAIQQNQEQRATLDAEIEKLRTSLADANGKVTPEIQKQAARLVQQEQELQSQMEEAFLRALRDQLGRQDVKRPADGSRSEAAEQRIREILGQ